ncbi:hypothetical protein D3C79_330840 [compost metagenome]
MVRGIHIRRILRTRVGWRQVQHDTDLPGVKPGAKRPHRRRMRQHRVVCHRRRPLEIDHIGVVEIIQVAAFDRHNRLIEGEPMHHPVAKQLKTDLRIAAKGRDHVTVFPAALLLHRHRHIEVEQRNKRLDALRQQLINHVVIKRHRLRIHLARSVRDQPRPTQRGTKTVVVEPFQQRDILAPVPVKGRRLLRPHLLMKAPGLIGVPGVPNCRAFTALQAVPFGLQCGAGTTPPKVLGKCVFHGSLLH